MSPPAVPRAARVGTAAGFLAAVAALVLAPWPPAGQVSWLLGLVALSASLLALVLTVRAAAIPLASSATTLLSVTAIAANLLFSHPYLPAPEVRSAIAAKLATCSVPGSPGTDSPPRGGAPPPPCPAVAVASPPWARSCAPPDASPADDRGSCSLGFAAATRPERRGLRAGESPWAPGRAGSRVVLDRSRVATSPTRNDRPARAGPPD